MRWAAILLLVLSVPVTFAVESFASSDVARVVGLTMVVGGFLVLGRAR